MTVVHIVAGGQFGSEGKGAFTAALVKRLAKGTKGDPVLVRVAGPNAGHTAYDASGRKWALRQIPVGAVVNLHSTIVIGQGSEIDPKVLQAEVDELEEHGIPIMSRLFVDENATVIEPVFAEAETHISTGTTGKGIGGARAARLLRSASRVHDLRNNEFKSYRVIDSASYLRHVSLSDIIIEGTQGYGLGLHTSYYPYVTSSNCRPGDFLAMTGLQPWDHELRPWLVFRSHPIRIAGNSGPLQDETNWAEIGQDVEYTTVTQKPRRIGYWDRNLAKKAIADCGGAKLMIAMNFVDYLWEEAYKRTEQDPDMDSIHRAVREMLYGASVGYLGTGPQTGVWY